jgi:MFS family permease
MTAVVLVIGATAVGLAAAARSTWSPCGLSMLASITPLAETGRGHRYRTTAAWFVAGGTVGGATLGAAMAAAAGVGSALPTSWLLPLGLCATLLTLAAELGVLGFKLPIHRRQVNERWLDQFRPWVYGAGFGWQIGSGLATYVMTPAVYLMIILVALSGAPLAAFAVGAGFGLVRGLSVLLGRRITDPVSLAAFHRAFLRAEPIVLGVVVVSEALVAVLLAGAVSVPLAVGVTAAAVAVAAGTLASPRFKRSRNYGQAVTEDG